MSREVFATKLVDTELKTLHLMLPRTDRCCNCGTSLFAMRLFFTRDPQTWVDVWTSPGSILRIQGDELKFTVCEADIKEESLSGIQIPQPR
jgi:hypothetical protein